MRRTTATKTPVQPSLPDAQLAELMSLLRGSDSVELKLTVPCAQQRAAVRALALDPLDAQIRQVVFFDMPDLALDKWASSCARAGSRDAVAIR
jgi:hypothetical protein